MPKDIWEDAILPDMLARMNVDEMYEDPSMVESTFRPKIKLNDWVILSNYILQLAPEELGMDSMADVESLNQFRPSRLAIDEENGALISYMALKKNGKLLFGDISGQLQEYDFQEGTSTKIYQGKTPITWYNRSEQQKVFTEVGILDPSERQQGKLTLEKDGERIPVEHPFHRPVHTVFQDLNDDGKEELIVSEFGNETGRLSLLAQSDDGTWNKTVLLNQPGCIRTLVRDMDNNGKLDLIVITSQAQESITILYQIEDLKFKAERVLQFSPVYGSSWFELVDYNGDGLLDIITVNGDNADKSYVQKPYHGMRIHLNQGENTFKEAYFYPLNGATRVLARDFDQDGDLDFALLSTFPDYERTPHLSFVYLENNNSNTFDFTTRVLEDANAGRWFLMDAADIDNDGDDDLVLSSFTYVFTPVPERLAERWASENVDILVLENKLK
ncbi:VCBS repeat-containing protein [uncultured Croceitalea sp.]|uniref:FG-GAP repeat domain-containing protein n=1 Tax=uncultured Croceitalea sp. TaxID=1798908 RepID=UPI003306503C